MKLLIVALMMMMMRFKNQDAKRWIKPTTSTDTNVSLDVYHCIKPTVDILGSFSVSRP